MDERKFCPIISKEKPMECKKIKKGFIRFFGFLFASLAAWLILYTIITFVIGYTFNII